MVNTINFRNIEGLEFLIGYSISLYVQNSGSNRHILVGLGLQIHLEKDH